MSFNLPKLEYAYNALEPIIDAQTMEIHHTKHHQAYIDNLNKAIEGTDLEGKSIEEICKAAEAPALRNNGGGHYNHYGGFEKFKADFSEAAKTRFGSGWAWLCKKANGEVEICSTPNQDNPLMPNAGCSGTPILGIDVWEHAYYLNYQNRRPDYISAFFEVINWDKVEELYNK